MIEAPAFYKWSGNNPPVVNCTECGAQSEAALYIPGVDSTLCSDCGAEWERRMIARGATLRMAGQRRPYATPRS